MATVHANTVMVDCLNRMRNAASVALETPFENTEAKYLDQKFLVSVIGDTRLSGAVFEVVYARGPESVDGYAFECISEPTELR